MRWMIREDQLDPEQREFLDSEIYKQGSVWVQGFAGSGKSILLAYAIKEVLRQEPRAKIAVVVYTHSLIDMIQTGLRELGVSVSRIPVVTYFAFRKNSERYDYIFCDEVQDLPWEDLANMKSQCRKLYLAGDSNQSIYEGTVEPQDIEKITNARPYTLNIIHRLTPSIINAVQKLVPEMDIFSAKQDATKQDVRIRLCEAANRTQEYEYIYNEALKGVRVGDSSAILFHNHDAIITFANTILELNNKAQWPRKENDFGKPDYKDMNKHLQRHGIPLEYIGNKYGSLESASGEGRIILMTYHSSKGLDFDNVFLPNQGLANFHLKASSEETLYMVAITRSRKNLYLSYFSGNGNSGFLSPNSYTKRFISDCEHIRIQRANQAVDLDLPF